MRWIIESEIVELVGLEAALLHDELLTRYLNNRKQPVLVDHADLLSKLPFNRRALQKSLTALKKEKLLCVTEKDGDERKVRKYIVLSPDEREIVFGTTQKKEFNLSRARIWK